MKTNLFLRRPGLLAIPLITVFLYGCGAAMKHEVSVSPYLKQHPVSSVYVNKPAFKEKVKRFSPTDLAEMLPENQPATAAKVTAILKNVLSSSIAVDSQFVPDAKFEAWAAKIQQELCIERVPYNVPPLDVPLESVLLLGIMNYGTEVDQIIVHPLPFVPGMKQYKLNEAKWNYVADFIVILISPRDGKVLFDIREGERRDKTDMRNDSVLDELTRTCAWVITSAFPPAPGYVPPAPVPAAPAPAATTLPAATPSTAAPSTTPSGTPSPAPAAPAQPAQPVPDDELR
jgi:hypothetical protein